MTHSPLAAAMITTAAAAAAIFTFPLLLRWGYAEAQRWQQLTRQVPPQAAPEPLATSSRRAWTTASSLLATADRTRLLGWVGAALLAGMLGAVFSLTTAQMNHAHALAPVSNMSAASALSALLLGVIAALLIALSVIDLSTRLLPDRLTLTLVITALGFHLLSGQLPLASGLLGAAAGYLGLWLLATLYRWLRGAQPMGRGDFAMLAGVGAWVGWQQLPTVLVTASISGLVAAAVGHLLRRQPALLSQQIVFGPALALGAVVGWLSLG